MTDDYWAARRKELTEEHEMCERIIKAGYDAVLAKLRLSPILERDKRMLVLLKAARARLERFS
jgi:hypothetical protein